MRRLEPHCCYSASSFFSPLFLPCHYSCMFWWSHVQPHSYALMEGLHRDASHEWAWVWQTYCLGVVVTLSAVSWLRNAIDDSYFHMVAFRPRRRNGINGEHMVLPVLTQNLWWGWRVFKHERWDYNCNFSLWPRVCVGVDLFHNCLIFKVYDSLCVNIRRLPAPYITSHAQLKSVVWIAD